MSFNWNAGIIISAVKLELGHSKPGPWNSFRLSITVLSLAGFLYDTRKGVGGVAADETKYLN